ncbi:MAG: LLM class F420-dependent oxidoreductase, partial [Pseudomonadota bacterium]|nr:LLM class F420-dependent oxidoreductase [Pseudomonadota bacterium]
FGINMNFLAYPAWAKTVAQHAETNGFESLWTGEHVVLPDPQQPPSPAPPQTAMTHPSTALAYLAAVTTRIKLATGITLIAQRNPVVLAKEMASLDILSGGRLIFGIGAGYLHQEFSALGVDFASRGARTDEYIDAMRALWTQQKPSFKGKYINFSQIDSQPRPAQDGGPPMIVGGASPAALRRAVTKGQGWYGFAMSVEAAKKTCTAIDQAGSRFERPSNLGKLELSITPPKPPTKAMAEDYAAIGISRLIPMLGFYKESNILKSLDNLATELL